MLDAGQYIYMQHEKAKGLMISDGGDLNECGFGDLMMGEFGREWKKVDSNYYILSDIFDEALGNIPHFFKSSIEGGITCPKSIMS